MHDFKEIPFVLIEVIYDLITYKKIRLLKILHRRNISLAFEDEYEGNSLHVACGASGSLECVKFFVENNILSLKMMGSCSGCPSSQATLKDGIEVRFKQLYPEINEVIAI